MKREARHLLAKAVDSLVLSIEHYNRPSDRGRLHAVLILMDHAFEMLLKAAIVHREGKIKKPGEKQTIGFNECLGKAVSESGVQFLVGEQELQLRALNSLRDAAQHYLLDLSEQHFYIHVQAGFTLFSDVYSKVFGEELNAHLPTRVLPVSTTPPTDISTIFEHDTKEIQRLLSPGRRKQIAARAKLRGLAIVNRAIHGEDRQPTDGELSEYGDSVAGGKEWHEVFPGVATIQLTARGTGPSLDLRISKRNGIPTRLVPEGTPGATVVAVHKIDSLGFYNLGRDQVASHLGLTRPKTTALIWYLKVKDDDEYFRRVTIGKSTFDRYSQKAIEHLREEMKRLDINKVWTLYKARPNN